MPCIQKLVLLKININIYFSANCTYNTTNVLDYSGCTGKSAGMLCSNKLIFFFNFYFLSTSFSKSSYPSCPYKVNSPMKCYDYTSYSECCLYRNGYCYERSYYSLYIYTCKYLVVDTKTSVS